MAKGRVVIAEETCKGCELCTLVCPKDLLNMSTRFNGKGYRPVMLVDPHGDCTGCALCAMVCPDAVITVYRNIKVSAPAGVHA